MQGQSREDSKYTQEGCYPRGRRKPLWPSVNKESDMPLSQNLMETGLKRKLKAK